MLDEKSILKICNAECSPDELSGFVASVDDIEFDADRPFEKYYRLERILSAIQKFREKEINDAYFSDWAEAYKWIVMGGFDWDNHQSPIYLKELVMWQICDWLHGMASFRFKCEYELYRYEKVFKTLDKAYSDIDDCDCVVSRLGVRDADIIALIINARSKYYLKLYSSVKYVNNKLGIELVSIEDVRTELNVLTENGYTELVYGIFDDSDFD